MLVLDMIEILPPLGKYKYDTWRILLMSYPVFMPKPSTHRMHNLGSIVPHIRQPGQHVA
jgi:hypothetical protein